MYKSFKIAGLLVGIVIALTGCGPKVVSVELPDFVQIEAGDRLKLEPTYKTEDGSLTEKESAEIALKYNWQWDIDNPIKAIVDQTGRVITFEPGTVTVTYGSKKLDLYDECLVNIHITPTDIIVPDRIDLVTNVTESATISHEIVPDNSTNFTISFESSDESVAIVDADGKVEAVSDGQCVITTKVIRDDKDIVRGSTIVTVTNDLS